MYLLLCIKNYEEQLVIYDQSMSERLQRQTNARFPAKTAYALHVVLSTSHVYWIFFFTANFRVQM
jgi:hypothetical protein